MSKIMSVRQNDRQLMVDVDNTDNTAISIVSLLDGQRITQQCDNSTSLQQILLPAGINGVCMVVLEKNGVAADTRKIIIQ